MRGVKRVLKILALIAGGVLAFAFLLAAFTQTQIFRDRLRAGALSALESLLDAEVHLGNFTGNLVRGFSVDHVSIKVGGDFLVTAERLDLQYDPFGLPGKTMSVSEITVVRPQVKLLRGKDGVWNFEHMIRPRPVDTTTGKPFDWVIRVHRLDIQEGTVVLVDSAALAEADHSTPDPTTVEYHRCTLLQFNLVTSALIKNDERRAAISSFSFVSNEPVFQLKDLSGEFVVTPSRVAVNNLHITTDRSHVELSAAMMDVDLFGSFNLRQLQRAPLRVSLHAHSLDFSELKKFISPLGFLHGEVTADVEAEGEFGDLRMQQLNLKMGKTELFLKGSVYNLHDPGNLLLKVKCTESRLYSPDILHLMPTIDLPDYESLGVTTLNMEFEGHPWDFKTRFLYETGAGTLKGDVALAIGGPNTLVYKGELVARNLNLAPVLNEERFAGQLNGVATIDGQGVTVERLAGMCSVKLDSSEFMGQRMAPSEASIEARGQVLSGTLNLGLGTMRSVLSASLDERDSTSQSFSVDGTVTSLNLQDILRDDAYNSDLTMAVKATGTGLTWKDLNGECLVNLSQSRFGEYKISSDSINLFLDQGNPHQKSLRLRSNIADFILTGAFDIQYLAKLLSFEVQNIREAVVEKFRVVDSTLVRTVSDGKIESLGKELAASTSALDAAYTLQIKDLEPISIGTGNRVFNGSGILIGTVGGDYHRLQMHGKLLLEDFFYGNVESGVLLQMGNASFDVVNLKPVNPLKDCDVRVVLDAGLLHLNRTEVDSARLTFTYQREYATYAARAIVNSDVRVALQGLSSLSEDQVVFTLNEFQLGYNDYVWRSDGGASIGFGAQGMRVADLVMRRDTQAVSISGSIGIGDSLRASVTGTHIDVAALKHLMPKDELHPREEPFKGTANFSASAKGTLSSPEYTLSLRADDVLFRSVPFGSIRGDFSYSNIVLQSQLEVDSRSVSAERPQLTITGTLPLNLALVGVEERLPEAPMNFSMRSEGIQMSILDPLLPTFNQLSGVMRCDVKIVGSPREPNYEGSIRIDSCSFLFVPNNIIYLCEGSFRPRGDRIEIVDAIIRNVPADKQFKREGLAHLSGDFALREFRPTDFNVAARGQLLIVKETTRESELSVYGNLFVEIGDRGLRFTGTIEHSLLKGNLTVRNSSLVFPPAQASKSQEYSSSVPLLIVDDTARVVESQPSAAVTRYFGTWADSELRQRQLKPEMVRSKSFLDGMQYDLDITTEGGNTELRMVFYTAPPEELDANINGRFSVTEDGRKWYGDLRVDKAYYNFYNKRFDARGSLRFTGDFLNPELDLKATYQGTRMRDTSSAPAERIVVTVSITGRRLEPKIEMSMTIDGEEYASYKGLKSGDVQTDAFAFIISGTFPLTRPEKNDVAANIGKSVGASLVTGATWLLSGTLSEFLRRQTGFITSLELGYATQGDFGVTPDIRLSGVAAGGLWRYGGRINEPLSNANVSILYSLGDVFDSASLRNFMVELDRKVEASTTLQTRDQAVRSARLFYRISF